MVVEYNISKTESVKRYGEAAQSRIPLENALKLNNGEVISATVEQADGNAVLLRTDDGRLLHAVLQGEVPLAQGDGVEAIVSKNAENCVLYMLNISRNGAQANTVTIAQATAQSMLSGMMSVLKRNPGMDAGVAMFLTENNIADTAENISALSTLSQGTGIGGLLGRILGAMAQPKEGLQSGVNAGAGEEALSFTAGQGQYGKALPANDNVLSTGGKAQPSGMAQYQYTARGGAAETAGLADMLKGLTENAEAKLHAVQAQTVSVPSGAVQESIALAQTKGAPAEFAPAHAQEAVPQPVPVQTDGTQPIAAFVRTAEPDAKTTSGNADSAVATKQAAADAKYETADIQSTAKEAQLHAVNTQASPIQAEDMMKPQPQQAQAQSASTQLSGLPAQSEEEPLAGATAPVKADKVVSEDVRTHGAAAEARGEDNARIKDIIRGIFIRPEAQTGGSIKKTASELPQTVKALKSALVQSDINNKEVCLKCADQALKQMELGSRTVPFEYMQLPISMKDGEYRTAELYVFKRKGGKKTSGEAGLTILVALDTQHIGRVETLIKETGGSILIEFRLEQPETTDMFKSNELALEKAAIAAGYRLTGVRYAGLETKTSAFNAAGLVDDDAGSPAEGVDVRI